MAEKQKLTLSVDNKLVEKAKKLGVNISDLTENILRHAVEMETKEVVTKEEIKPAYERLFNAMLPAMKKFGTSVVVGNKIFDEENYREVRLLISGGLWIRETEETPKFDDVSFYSPKKILSIFIDSLIEASERNKEKLKELEMFRRVIEALTETTISESLKERP